MILSNIFQTMGNKEWIAFANEKKCNHAEPWPSLPVVPVFEPPGVEPPGVLSGVVGALRSTLVLPSLIALITAA